MNTFSAQLQDQFVKMQQTGILFRSSITGRELWELYLESFEDDKNPVFRDPESSVHNCNNCNNFIRRYGNIVSISDDLEIMTMFDFEADDEMKQSASALSQALRKAPIQDKFIETFDELNKLPYESVKRTMSIFQLGVASNVKRYTKEEAEKFGVVQPGEIRTFNHMHAFIDRGFIDFSGRSVEALMGDFRDDKNVFQRAMEEIPLDTLMLVQDLIVQGSLLNGDTHLHKVQNMISVKTQYDETPAGRREVWCWMATPIVQFPKFKNELIGVLCTELAEGKDLNDACKDWNIRVDPANYMKAKSPITKLMIEQAAQFCDENGYSDSFKRRLAKMDDIKVSEIRHINTGDGEIKSVSIFDSVKAPSTRHKRSEFEGVEEVSIDKFMKDILPGCTSVEAFVTNQHEGHFVTLTTADEGSKQIFKWNNPYSWTFNGNLAGKSEIKEAVKREGGNVTGDLRFSLIWNEDGKSIVDLDAHCSHANGHIYYGNRQDLKGGILDVDMINPTHLGVENITWQNRNRMFEGEYKFFVRNFNHRNHSGFKVEIEFDGETYSYEYPSHFDGDIDVAVVTLKNGQFSIKHIMPESEVSSREIYGLETNRFHQVNLICVSPNHWGSNNVGNKHYFMFLKDCKVPDHIRGFHAENLLPELAKHRKVLEVLGSTTMISPGGDQLSGLGFNATVRDEVILRLKGSHKRVIRLKI